MMPDTEGRLLRPAPTAFRKKLDVSLLSRWLTKYIMPPITTKSASAIADALLLLSGVSNEISSFGFGRERPERPKAPSPGQAKRHPGYRVLEQLRPVRAKALPLTDRVLKIGINHCYCCPMRISKARLMLLPFQGATALTRGTQGVASLALGYVLHWASSPLLLNPKLQ